MNDGLEFIRSNKGGMKIIHRGYMYTVHKKRQGGGIRWRCTQRSLHCKGSISTGNGPPKINMPHNHIPDPHSVALARCKQIEEFPDLTEFLETECEELLGRQKMAEMGYSTKRHRKCNFTKEEIDVLCSLVDHYKPVLESKGGLEIPYSEKYRAWVHIAQAVSSVGVVTRTIPEIKNKWKKYKAWCKQRKMDGSNFLSYENSVPLIQRMASSSSHSGSAPSEQLQSQPLSPTKLKVTRQSSKTPKLQPIAPKPSELPEPVQNEEVCLRWNSHHSNMQSAFPNLLKKEQFVDVTLVADGKILKCHRVILSSCSTYFEEILDSIERNQHPVVFLKGIPFWILKSLTDFMYAGEVNIEQNRLQELLDVAEVLKIKGLAGKSDSSQEPLEEKPEKETLSKKFEQSSRLSQPPVLEPQVVKPTPKPPPKRSERIERADEDWRGSTTTHVKPAVLPPEQIPITDPLALLEPTYQEETRLEGEPSISKQRDQKNINRKSIGKKIRKRKSPEIEEAQVPVRLRRGTRSRPNVKLPKYYHNDFETHVEQPTDNVKDPLSSHLENIKTEPVEVDSGNVDFVEEETMNDSENESEDVLITGIEADTLLVPNIIKVEKEVEKAVPFVNEYSGSSPEPQVSVRLNSKDGTQEKLTQSNEIDDITVISDSNPDMLEDDSRDMGLDISETVVQNMDSDVSTFGHKESNENVTRNVGNSMNESHDPVNSSEGDILPESTSLKTGDLHESPDPGNQEMNSLEEDENQETNSPKDVENDADEVAASKGVNDSYTSQVDSIQITHVISLNAEENDLMDIDESKFVDTEINFDEDQEKTEENEETQNEETHSVEFQESPSQTQINAEKV